MKYISVSIMIVTIISFIAVTPVFCQLNPDLLPLEENVYYIDHDGDGYGVAAPNGPDADDNDPTVTTYESAIAQYGTLEKLVNHLGYYPERIRYIDPGDDNYKFSDLQPGDMVIYKEGTYTKKYILSNTDISGTADKPIVLLAMPGKQVVLQTPDGEAINTWKCSYLTFDGFELTGHVVNSYGIQMHYSKHIMMKNIYSHHHKIGIRGFEDLHDISIENCVIADNEGSHGIYLGSRDLPNTNITVHGCRIYRNGRHGIQHNGRVTNMLLEKNIVHSNELGGFSLVLGTSDSIVRNNLIFNNNKQGIIFYDYDDSTRPIADQNNNLVENNIIWIGQYSWNGSTNPTYFASILFNDTTETQQGKMENNIIRNNILVTHSDAILRFKQQRFFDTTTIEDNLLYNPKGSARVLDLEGTKYDFEEFQSLSSSISGNVFEDPNFVDVSVDYYNTPEKFNFAINGVSKKYLLSITKEGEGSGLITSEPSGIGCGDTCQTEFIAGTSVLLTAEPDPGSTFEEWTGACSGIETCQLTIDQETEVTAVFSLQTYTIIANSGQGGTITPSGTIIIPSGTNQHFTIALEAEYQIKEVLVDGISQGPITSYTFSNVQSDHMIQATFEVIPTITYTIDASAGPGGSIAPTGAVSVEEGNTQSFTITPDAGSQVKDVLVDGSSQGPITSYTFSNVQTDHSIEASFKAITTTSSYFGFDEFGGTWHDAEPVHSENLAWAAAAANTLTWARWDTPIYDTAQGILENFETHWTDDTGLMEYGWRWWLSGYEPTETESAAQVTTPGGNHWSEYNFFDYFYEDWANFSEGMWSHGEQLLSTIDEYLHSSYGVTVALYGEESKDLTVWGYEYDTDGNYTGLWVTDATDSVDDMILLSVELRNGLWYLDVVNQYGYQDWFIGGVQALEQRPLQPQQPIPEPGTFFLMGIGLLLGVFGYKRKVHRKNLNRSS